MFSVLVVNAGNRIYKVIEVTKGEMMGSHFESEFYLFINCRWVNYKYAYIIVMYFQLAIIFMTPVSPALYT